MSATRDPRIAQLVEDFVASMGGLDAMRRGVDFADLVGLIKDARIPTPEVKEAFRLMSGAAIELLLLLARPNPEAKDIHYEKIIDEAIATIGRALGIPDTSPWP